MSDPMHLVCPHCHAVNRVASARLNENPNCGRCHNALFSGAPLALDSANFDRFVSRSGLPILVDFWADWCGPCKAMAPGFAQAAKTLEPNIILAKLDTEAATDIASRFGIRSIPTLILFRDGREIARQAGAMGQSDIVDWTRRQLVTP
ncbi:thioredoxin TrxC [Salinicola socius]|uniref:Thioredoxin n=1 Tax=Salinicola socius TaxID=404433 RepID=A0A1Q8SR44_9GAMM|nr:thioredoxin TrxC [Salinicola socius]OLO03895.1 thiol reductase thioredoxin [Salinicola socius]